MDQRQIVVETNLNDEIEYRGSAFTRHARTRFVKRPKEPESPKLPEPGAAWCPLTVRARLHRLAEVFRRVPHDPDTRPGQYRSCMPAPVREVFKDLPGEPMRIPVARADLSAAKQVLDSLVTLTPSNRMVAWGIANNLSDRRVGREMRSNHHAAAKAKQELLAFLADDWQQRGWAIEPADIEGARAFIHRNLD